MTDATATVIEQEHAAIEIEQAETGRQQTRREAAQFAERVHMVKGRWNPDASSATAYAWFVWRAQAIGEARSLILQSVAPEDGCRLAEQAVAPFARRLPLLTGHDTVVHRRDA
jgi:hypothetical protein